MNYLITAVENALNSQNWRGALFISLSLPDICGKLETPDKKSGERYANWFAQYMPEYYSFEKTFDGVKYSLLNGSDCYALRCALLHEGVSDISEQKAQCVLTRFHFVFPPERGMLHCNRSGDVLQLQVDIFCRDICNGVKTWLSEVIKNKDIKNRIDNVLKIYPPGFDF